MTKALKNLHRKVWQRLPRRLRRGALFMTTAVTAPRPTRNALPKEPVIIAGPLSTASGLGHAARQCLAALQSQGLKAYGIDLTAELMQTMDEPGFSFEDGSRLEGAGTLILHVNAPFVPYALTKLGPKLVRGKYIVGHWAWELPNVPDEWRRGVDFVHEIWAPSHFTQVAIASIAGRRPVRLMPYPLAVPMLVPRSVLAGSLRPFTVLCAFNMASGFERKNPLAAIAAFRQAFGNDESARLVIKCANGHLFPPGLDLLRSAVNGASNMILVDEVITQLGMEQLYDDADALISLHRSEGFGYIIAEAMARGVPCVATNWSGSTDLLSAETGMPVHFSLTPARDPQHTYDYPDMVWAEANVEAAAAALMKLRADPALQRQQATAARAFVEHYLSGAGFARAVREALVPERAVA
jgi:glycosyltransferase involved in cell wall biosynthesis